MSPKQRGLDAAAERVIGRIDAAAGGNPPSDTIPTGFASIDRLLGGGLRRQDLAVLCGDVASGKSALALAIAVRAAAAGMPTMLLSGEMTPDRIMERAIALEGRAAVDDLRLGRLDETGRAAVGAAALRLRDAPLMVRPLLGESFDEVRETGAVVPPRGLLVVDSIELVAPPRSAAQIHERLATATRALKALALERDLAILAVTQLPRLRRDRTDPRPTLDDLGGRGAIGQQADVVLALYREEMYRPGYGVEGAAELIVAKNRNGATGFVDLFFYATWLRFEDMADPER